MQIKNQERRKDIGKIARLLGDHLGGIEVMCFDMFTEEIPHKILNHLMLPGKCNELSSKSTFST